MIMRDKIYNLLIQSNLDVNRFNIDKLHQAGINNIIKNIDYYYDKPYTCESVLKELFDRGVLEELKIQSN